MTTWYSLGASCQGRDRGLSDHESEVADGNVCISAERALRIQFSA